MRSTGGQLEDYRKCLKALNVGEFDDIIILLAQSFVKGE